MATDETGRLRASHADREQAIEVLKVAFMQGRLDRHELDARVAWVFAARTYRELAAVTADIPAGQILAQPFPAQPAPARPFRAARPGNRAVKSGLSVIAVGTALAASLWAAALLTGNATAFMLAITMTVAYAGALILSGAVMLESRPRERGRAQPLSGRPLGQLRA
jgi:hypothetical protein